MGMTSTLQRRLHSKLIQPVIIEFTSAEAMKSAIPDLKSYIDVSQLTPLHPPASIREILSGRDRVLSRFQNPLSTFKILERFKMAAAPLFPGDIEEIAAWPEVAKIYPDRIMSILQYPTVPPEHQYTSPTGQKFTTTTHTKALMGADKANKEGYTGKGVILAVLDTGGSPLHFQTRNMEYYSTTRDKGQITDHCFDAETEIFTENGFVKFSDLDATTKVGSMDSRGYLTMQKPIAIQKIPYKGKMIHFFGHTFDMMVTPEHNMFVRQKNTSRFRIVSAEKLLQKSLQQHELLMKVDWIGEEPEFINIPNVSGSSKAGTFQPKNLRFKTEDFVRFLGWWLTEGSIDKHGEFAYRVSIAQSRGNELYRKEIAETLERMGIAAYENSQGFEFHSKQLYTYLMSLGHAKDKRIPADIKKLSPRLLRLLIETMLKGNGSRNEFYTTSKSLAEDFQEIALKSGYASKLTLERKKSFKGEEEIYRVSVRRRMMSPRICTDVEIVNYEGIVYDVTVPNHVILVRRNGFPIWSGNCGHGEWVESCAAGREWFDRTLMVKVEGMAPEAHLIGVQCLAFIVGIGFDSDVLEAIQLAIERGAHIVNMSLGSEEVPSDPAEDPQIKAVDEMVKNGIIPVIAAGNSGNAPGTINSPGCADNALTVGAYDPFTGLVADFSCIPGSIPIYTEKGPVPISKLSKGTKAYGVHGFHVAPSEVIDVWSSGIRDVYRVDLGNRFIEATNNHPFLVLNRDEHYGCWFEWKRLGELRVGDYIVVASVPDGRPYKFALVEKAYNKVFKCPEATTENIMWLLGLWIGDGNADVRLGLYGEKGRVIFHIPESQREIREEVIKVLRENFGLTHHIHTYKNRIEVNSLYLTKFLKMNGFEGDSHTKRVPRWVFTLPLEQRLAFIAGYLDADGYVRKNGNIALISVNRTLLEDIRELCILSGLEPINIYKYEQTVHFKKVGGTRHVYSKGYVLILSNVNTVTVPTREPRFKARLKGIILPTVRCKRVKQIAYVGKKEVFDMHVGNGNFIANGIVVHNSRGPTPWNSVKPDVVAPGVNIYSGVVGVLDPVGDGLVNRLAILSGTSMACLPPNTLIETKEGFKSIEEVHNPMVVPCYVNEKTEFGRITSPIAIYQGIKKCYKLKTKYVELVASYDHPIFAVREGNMPEDSRCHRSATRRGKRKLTMNGRERRTWLLKDRIGEVPLYELKTGDWILVKRRTSFNGSIPEECKNWTPDEWRLLGLCIADGYLNSRLRYRQVFWSQLKEETRSYYMNALTNSGYHVKDYRGIKFYVDSASLLHIYQKLIGLGNDKVGWTLKVLNLPLNALKYVIQGYLDGDGWAMKDKNGLVQIGFSDRPENLRLLKLALMRFGVRTSVIKERRKESKKWGTEHYILITGEDVDKFAREIGACVKKIPEKKSRSFVQKMGVRPFSEEYEFQRIEEIKEVGEFPVYDIRVDPDHNFIAEGIVVHNTPHIAGILACARQFYDGLGVALTVNLVKAICEAYGEAKNNDSGWGLLTWDMFKRYAAEHIV
jgi:intein/homing endonuclease